MFYQNMDQELFVTVQHLYRCSTADVEAFQLILESSSQALVAICRCRNPRLNSLLREVFWYRSSYRQDRLGLGKPCGRGSEPPTDRQ
jgi:hypothetical protein